MTRRFPEARGWHVLAEHHATLQDTHLASLFNDDPERAQRYAIECGPLYLDFSKNHLTNTTLDLFAALIDEAGLAQARERLFNGETTNISEARAALHTALRAGSDDPHVPHETAGVIKHELERMTQLHADLHANRMTGFTGKPIDTIVNIGIGGSDLGPRLLAQALDKSVNVHFVANLDPVDLRCTLDQCRAETTLFVISSKSFGTLETHSNHEAARRWLHAAGCHDTALQRHFVAATANAEAARAAGIREDLIFHFWDWVGGRYSVWSAAGLSGFLAVGPEAFRRFLAGGRRIDEHFSNADWQQNLPVMLALIGIWYINYFDCSNHAIVPYEQRLALLPDYLCQLVMESDGKSVTTDGRTVTWSTAPVTWGGVGSNAQHSFFQALHQGTQRIPVDFLAPLTSNSADTSADLRQRDLLLSCLAQSSALMSGSQSPDPHRCYPGNRPSNMLLYEQLSPEVIGALLAVYEHKTFTQAHLWQINPFDQWGVELGKTMTQTLTRVLDNDTDTPVDSSTRALLARYQRSQDR